MLIVLIRQRPRTNASSTPKTLTMHDIMEYAKSENFKYLVIEASHGDYYGFNIKVKKNRPMP
jgi:hypothetical protein